MIILHVVYQVKYSRDILCTQNLNSRLLGPTCYSTFPISNAYKEVNQISAEAADDPDEKPNPTFIIATSKHPDNLVAVKSQAVHSKTNGAVSAQATTLSSGDIPSSGHINPALQLAKRLMARSAATVTFSTAVSGHRKMFPSSPAEEVEDGPITYIPYSDGYDDGFVKGTHDANQYLTQFKAVGSATFSSVVRGLTARGHSVDCIVYTFLLPWAADVARAHGIPSAQYWIQPATVFAIYYRYFHGYDSLIAAHSKDPMFEIDLPGLPSLRIRDLPSFLTITSPDDPYAMVLDMVRGSFDTLEREGAMSNSKPKVLMNTFAELEADAVSAVEEVDLIPIGPTVDVTIDLFEQDGKKYMEWLDSKAEGSVVYVSFGSLAVVQKRQMQEIADGLKGSGRPYLWVVREDCRWEGLELEEDGENEMVVRWCSQVRVLSHRSVGCFVTHCGWNSTVESIVYGVPTVGVPQWTDQGTNAMLAERVWVTGVRGEVDGDGVLESGELRRCLDLVMGEGERGEEIRKNVRMWRDKAREAIDVGGSSEQNLRTFVDGITKFHQNNM